MIKGSITAKPQAFAAAVKWAAKFVAAKPTAPVQGGLALEVEYGTGELVITAFSENVTARAMLPIEGDGAGRAIVSGRLMAELVGTFPDKPVSITGHDSEPQVVVSVGRWRGTLPAMDEADMPALPEAPGSIGTVGGEAFATMVHKASVAASKDLSKKIALACVYLIFGEDAVFALASDSYRAVRASVPFTLGADLGGPVTALVLGTTMTEVAGAFIGPDDITIGWDAHTLSLTSATRSVVLRQMGEEFPADVVAGFFRQAGSLPQHVTVTAADLLQPLKRAAIVREKDGPIKVAFAENLITLSAAAEDVKRDSDEEVDAQYAGPEHLLAFNPGYFAEALASAPGAEVDLAMTTERITGVLLTVPGDESWQHMLMPLRLS